MNPLVVRRAAGAAHDADHDELRGRERREADLDDDLAEVARLRRIIFGVALDEERFRPRLSLERAGRLQLDEVTRQLALDPDPKPRVVRLERRPAHVDVDIAA